MSLSTPSMHGTSSSRPARRSRSGLEWWALLPLCLFGFWLRFHQLGVQGFWLDEAYTWYLLRPSWREIWNVMLLISDTSPLYYLVVRLWAVLAGSSEFALRCVGAGVSVLCLPAVYGLGRALLGRRAGLWACALLALSPFAVWYARDARPYGFYILFATLALWGFWRWAERGRSAWPWVLASAALYLTHYAAALFAFAQAAYLIMGLRQRPLLFRRWFAWQAAAAAPIGVYLLAFLLRRQPITGNTWIPKPGLLAIGQTLLNFLSANAETLSAVGIVLAFAGGTALVAGCRLIPNRRAVSLLLWWLFLPMTATWLLSFRLPAYIDRFFFPEITAFVLLLGGGLAVWPATRPGWVKVTAAAVALVLCGGLLWSSVRVIIDPAYFKEDWRGAAGIVNAQPADRPLLAQDGEVLLGLLPYQTANRPTDQALPKNLDRITQETVVVLRSLHDTNHGLTKSALFDPLTESGLAGWFAAHPAQVQKVYRLAGVGIVILTP